MRFCWLAVAALGWLLAVLFADSQQRAVRLDRSKHTLTHSHKHTHTRTHTRKASKRAHTRTQAGF